MRETIRLMLTVAEQRMEAASILTHSTHSRYPSGALLRALAMELLLKTALRCAGKSFAGFQGCADLWSRLPAEVQDRVVEVARQHDDDLMTLEPVQRIFAAYDEVIGVSRFDEGFVGHWQSIGEQEEVHEDPRLLALSMPSGASLEGGRLAAGLAQYIEDSLSDEAGDGADRKLSR